MTGMLNLTKSLGALMEYTATSGLGAISSVYQPDPHQGAHHLTIQRCLLCYAACNEHQLLMVAFP